MKIGICGSTNLNAETATTALRMGRAIGRNGHEVIIGTDVLLPYLVAKTAHQIGSIITGYAPLPINRDSTEFHEHDPDPDNIMKRIVYLPDGVEHLPHAVQAKIRNMIMVGDMDGAIFIAGGWGTTTEFSMARSLRIPVALVKGSGGAADALHAYAQQIEREDTESPILHADDPDRIIRHLEEEYAKILERTVRLRH